MDARLCPYCGEILKVDLPADPKKVLPLPQKDRKGFAIASLFPVISFIVSLGLANIINFQNFLSTLFAGFAFLSPFLSVPGIIFGIIGLRSKHKSIAIAGIVTNALLFIWLLSTPII
jgi:hypothetical protein